MSVQYIDAHTHLNSDALYPDRQTHLSDFIACWGRWLINVWVDMLRNQRAIQITEESKQRYPTCVVKATVWWHPSEVSYGHILSDEHIDRYCRDLEELLTQHRAEIVAIGECGIDAHYPWFSAQTALLQQSFFRAQCCLARKYALPVVVHSRDAFDLTVEVLQEFTDLAVYVHCRGYGPEEMMRLIVTLPQVWFWFCGNITYPKATLLRASLLTLGSHQAYLAWRVGLLVETDAPRLAPQSHRGQRHTPAGIVGQYAYLADLLGAPLDVCTARVFSDRSRLYSL